MKDYGMAYACVMDYLEDAIDMAFSDFQEQNGIESGDVPPSLDYGIGMAKDALTASIRKAMEWQGEHAPRVKFEQTYAPDTDTTFIFKDTYMWKDLAKREVVGFYSGEPNAGRLAKYKDVGTVAEY